MSKKGWGRSYFCTRSYEYDQTAAATAGNALLPDAWRQIVVNMCDMLVKNGTADYIVLIFHDKDPLIVQGKAEVDENNVPQMKPLHAHMVVHWRDTMPQSQVMRHLGLSREKSCIRIRDVKDRTRWMVYLTHGNQKDRTDKKFEYEIKDVIVFNPAEADPEAWYRKMRSGKMPEDEAEKRELRDKFLAEHVRLIEMGKETADDALRLVRSDEETIVLLDAQYDADFEFKARSLFDKAEEEYKRDCMGYYQTHNRCLETVYFQAPGGTRKTELARLRGTRKLAEAGCRLGFQTIAPKGGGNLTFDPAGNYSGQPIAIANEFALAAMGLDMVKDMFDPLHVPVVNSRNTDKVWFPNQAYLTTSNDLEEQIAVVVLGWAKTQRKKGAETKGSGEDGRMTSAEWEAFRLSRADISDQIRQVRRRFPVLVRIEPPEPGMDAPVMVARIMIREDARNICLLHLGKALASETDPLKFGLNTADLYNRRAREKKNSFEVEVGAGLGRGVMVTVTAQDDGGDPRYSHRTVWYVDGKAAAMERPLRDDMRTDVHDEDGSLWSRGFDYGAYTTTHILAYDPANDADLAKVDHAIDEAFAMYYETNHLSVTPATVPLVPPLDEWRKAENEIVRNIKLDK